MGQTPEQAVKAELQSAIAEALEESKFPTAEKAEANSWDDFDEAPAPAADNGPEPSTGELVNTVETPEGQEPQEFEIPEFYRKDLEGLPVEKQKDILAHLQQQDTYIQKLQERLSETPETPAEPSVVQEPEEITDEALAIALGYNPEDAYNQPSVSELKLARTVLNLEDKLERIETTETVREVQSQWNRNLDDLEETYGKLPFDRLQVLRYAVEEGIASPFETYFKLTAPAKREVQNAVAEARRQAAKQAEGGGVKPRSVSGESPVIDPSTTSLRDAVAIAMKEAETDTGLSWRKLFSSRKVLLDE